MLPLFFACRYRLVLLSFVHLTFFNVCVYLIVGMSPFALGGAKIHLASQEVDFGLVPQYSVRRVVLQIGNNGDSELIIHKVIRSCSCITAEMAPIIIAHGSVYELPISYQFGSKVGSVSGFVTLLSNDMDVPSITISMKGQVFREFYHVPANIDFGMLEVGQQVRRTFELFALGLEARRINTVTYDTRLFDISRRGSDVLVQKGEPAIFEIVLKDGAPLGKIKEKITILFEGTPERRYVVPILGIVHGNVCVEPEKLVFRDVVPGEKITKDIYIESQSGNLFTLLDCNADFDCFSLYFSNQKLRRHKVSIILNTTKCTANIYGLIRLITDMPKQRELVVPVTVVFKNADPIYDASKSGRFDHSPVE